MLKHKQENNDIINKVFCWNIVERDFQSKNVWKMWFRWNEDITECISAKRTKNVLNNVKVLVCCV